MASRIARAGGGGRPFWRRPRARRTLATACGAATVAGLASGNVAKAGKAPAKAPGDPVRAAFDAADTNKNGLIDVDELANACARLGLPSSDEYVADLLAQYDKDHSGTIDFAEFKTYIARQEKTMKTVYNQIDKDHNGAVTEEELLKAVRKLGIPASPKDAAQMMALLDKDGDKKLTFEEFRNYLGMLPVSQMRENAAWSLMSSAVDLAPTTQPTSQVFKKLAIGGIAGAIAKSIVAPAERIREITQVAVGKTNPIAAVQKIVQTEGFFGLWRGNNLVLMRIVPFTAIQFCLYDVVKDLIVLSRPPEKRGKLGVLEGFLAGTVAGTAATLLVYPMDCLKTQISAGGLQGGLVSCARQVYASEGLLKGFYKGISASISFNIVNTAVGFNIQSGLADAYKGVVKRRLNPGEEFVCGGLAGVCCAIITLPLYMVSSRLRVQGVAGRPVLYNGLVDALKKTAQTEGVPALYKGMAPTIVKVFPNIGIMFLVKDILNKQQGIGGLNVYKKKPAEAKK